MASNPIGCLGMLLKFFGGGDSGGNGGAAPPLPEVIVNKYFFTDAEINFFRVLQSVVGDRGIILAQVSLKQLIWFPGNNQSNRGRSMWLNKTDKRSIDFVICDARTLRPRVAIELDDTSHRRPDRERRDDEVEQILEAADLPLLRVPTSRSYDTRELAATILPYLQ